MLNNLVKRGAKVEEDLPQHVINRCSAYSPLRPLHYAVYMNRPKAIRALLQHNVDISMFIIIIIIVIVIMVVIDSLFAIDNRCHYHGEYSN